MSKESTVVIEANPHNKSVRLNVWRKDFPSVGGPLYRHVIDNLNVTPEDAIDIAKALITSAMFANKNSVVYKKLLREAEREVEDMLK